MNLTWIKTFNIIFLKYKNNIFYPAIISFLLIGVGLFIFALNGIGTLLHFDEWVGRGLYPGLALAYGADLYEPFKGPHITLYGAGTALFYAPAAIASTPQIAIWISFLLNISTLLFSIGYLLNRLLSSLFPKILERSISIIALLIISISILAIDPTTEGVLRVHSDLPAFFFLLSSLCFFDAYLRKPDRLLILSSCFCLSLSVWAKAPTLPATLFPVIYFVSGKQYRQALSSIVYLLVAFFVTSIIVFCFYGYEDTITILYKHLKANLWSDRNTLFYGKSTLVQMSYIEAIPLLFRFFVMYLAEYWYIFFHSILCTFFTWSTFSREPKHYILKNLCIIYILTLPACLAALAHYGSVHNSLLFANAIGILIFIFSFISIGSTIFSSKKYLIVLTIIAPLCTLPLVRISKSAPNNTLSSPQQQAFDYLKSGKDDVYFGWYPIAHILHSGKAPTSIEVPIHLSESMPKDVDFSINHFPEGSKYLATCHVGYGGNILQQYLGNLDEVSSPLELSEWRLFEIRDRKTP